MKIKFIAGMSVLLVMLTGTSVCAQAPVTLKDYQARTKHDLQLLEKKLGKPLDLKENKESVYNLAGGVALLALTYQMPKALLSAAGKAEIELYEKVLSYAVKEDALLYSYLVKTEPRHVLYHLEYWGLKEELSSVIHRGTSHKGYIINFEKEYSQLSDELQRFIRKTERMDKSLFDHAAFLKEKRAVLEPYVVGRQHIHFNYTQTLETRIAIKNFKTTSKAAAKAGQIAVNPLEAKITRKIAEINKARPSGATLTIKGGKNIATAALLIAGSAIVLDSFASNPELGRLAQNPALFTDADVKILNEAEKNDVLAQSLKAHSDAINCMTSLDKEELEELLGESDKRVETVKKAVKFGNNSKLKENLKKYGLSKGVFEMP
ncbi:hypothetical protein Emin_0254 [Elusimicrobium minutum Pei191]|uniref:Uncharacterized protein n=1 Tax=Elusimicrobium minutum (strain Pei191) TaxID=445932 RepID=B2KB57_ELUMP|nr:hypothetical protein [Elusimicrobium minutum]ACC97816.1 hypothetical protein Emin_0254 [Elusimicrobium minutum Pei191]